MIPFTGWINDSKFKVKNGKCLKPEEFMNWLQVLDMANKSFLLFYALLFNKVLI